MDKSRSPKNSRKLTDEQADQAAGGASFNRIWKWTCHCSGCGWDWFKKGGDKPTRCEKCGSANITSRGEHP
ncbi:MAG: hypothetical protein IKH38_04815 [Clostridia bacterium]|nr:hypothetical protein [Clostridia bacterium]